MGYTLRIGEAKLNIDKEYGYVSVQAEQLQSDTAPAYGEPTDGTSSRWPSYVAWHDAMRFVGLHDLFFDKEAEPICLIHSHPGCVALTQSHKATIDLAHELFYKKYPNCKAGYSPNVEMFSGDEDINWPMENNYATRLEWLKFWVDYAIENCENPVFYNS